MTPDDLHIDVIEPVRIPDFVVLQTEHGSVHLGQTTTSAGVQLTLHTVVPRHPEVVTDIENVVMTRRDVDALIDVLQDWRARA